MNKPIPINHMMAWGAITGALTFVTYGVIFGIFNLTEITQWLVIIGAGGFGGYTLGALSGMLLGFTLAGHSEVITRDALYNRQWQSYLTVFLSVFIVGFALLFAIPEFVAHPIALALLGGFTSVGAAWHYLYRMEEWLEREKPKRKAQGEVDSRRLEDANDSEIDYDAVDGQQSERARKG